MYDASLVRHVNQVMRREHVENVLWSVIELRGSI